MRPHAHGWVRISSCLPSQESHQSPKSSSLPLQPTVVVINLWPCCIPVTASQ